MLAPLPDPPVFLDTSARAQLLAAWRAAHGTEPCGFLLGESTSGGFRVEEIVEATNHHPRPAEGFLLSPTAQLAARHRARSQGCMVIGTWHGHLTGPPQPSRADRIGLMRVPAAVRGPGLMLIVGPGPGSEPVLQAWCCHGLDAEPLALL